MPRRSSFTLDGAAAFSVSCFSFSTLLGFAFVPASASSFMNLNGGFAWIIAVDLFSSPPVSPKGVFLVLCLHHSSHRPLLKWHGQLGNRLRDIFTHLQFSNLWGQGQLLNCFCTGYDGICCVIFAHLNKVGGEIDLHVDDSHILRPFRGRISVAMRRGKAVLDSVHISNWDFFKVLSEKRIRFWIFRPGIFKWF